MEQLNKLDLLERCIKESLRLYPPVPWIGRVLKNYIKIGDKSINNYMTLFVGSYSSRATIAIKKN